MAISSHASLSLCCYTCWGTAAVEGPVPYVADPAAWPDLDCPITPGCEGRLVPEALN
ncbi:MAG: hypothetical protein ABR586_03530 [Thermoplasmatota archaeon]